MRIPLPIQTGRKNPEPDEFEDCKGNCCECKWNRLEKNTRQEVWAICTSPDGRFERKEY